MKNQETHSIEKAIEIVKMGKKGKFDATVELHVNLGIDIKKPEQSVRTVTTLPHGTGKTQKVAVFASEKVDQADIQLTETDLTKIEKGELKPHVDFDVVVAEPAYMAKLSKIARVLGPQGMMPNPKSGTVTDNVKKAVEQIKKGKVEIRNEPNAPIVHTIIGKMSFDNKHLAENFEEVMSTLRSSRPQKVKPESYIGSCFISSTMGKSVRVAC